MTGSMTIGSNRDGISYFERRPARDMWNENAAATGKELHTHRGFVSPWRGWGHEAPDALREETTWFDPTQLRP